jgi:solute carrier family 6 (neurotransmitter transporter)
MSSVFFAVVFLLQFLLLSFCFGIPLFVLFCSLGQYLGSGLIDMWRISPIFQVISILKGLGHEIMYNSGSK